MLLKGSSYPVFLITFLLFSCSISKQKASNLKSVIWQDLQIESLTIKPENLPRKFRLLRLNVKEFISDIKTDTISLPLPEKGFVKFSISESSVMSPELAAKYSTIKTFKGLGITEKSSLRFERNDNKFYFSILKGNQIILINPASTTDTTIYISYYKADADTSTRKSFELPAFIESK
jgi:hypothetical protein